MNKLIGFKDKLAEEIQAYADEHFNGNFSMAVRYLCVIGMKTEQGVTR
jgi:hypothetical protein